jgi:hypothetical protein
MCYPRTRNLGPVTFNRDRAQLREHLDLDVDNDTLNFYMKKEFYVAKDIHELQIQIETFRKWIKIPTVHDSVGTQGLTTMLRGIRANFTLIQEMIVVSPNFCLKILSSLDRKFQRFLTKISEMTNVATANRDIWEFLPNKAKDTLEKLADGAAPDIMLPSSLL